MVMNVLSSFYNSTSAVSAAQQRKDQDASGAIDENEQTNNSFSEQNAFRLFRDLFFLFSSLDRCSSSSLVVVVLCIVARLSNFCFVRAKLLFSLTDFENADNFQWSKWNAMLLLLCLCHTCKTIQTTAKWTMKNIHQKMQQKFDLMKCSLVQNAEKNEQVEMRTMFVCLWVCVCVGMSERIQCITFV